MFNFIKTSFVSAMISMSAFAFTTNTYAQSENTPALTAEQIEQSNYLKGAMQREIWSIILTDTFELQQEELKKGIIFKYEGKYNVSKYQEWMTDICVQEGTASCPEAFFTRKDTVPIAAMYPNGKMMINLDLILRLTDDEVYFAIAHEMGHFVHQDSFKNTKVMAASIVDNGFMVAEMEKMVAASFMIPGMREYHHKIENEADEFAKKYMKKNHRKIDCMKMFQKMIGDDKPSTDQHDGPEQRCAAINAQ